MDKIRPLDILFFRGNWWFSKVVAISELLLQDDDSFTHIGIVVNRNIMPSLQVKDDRLYLWEVGGELDGSEKDIETGSGKIGVRVVDLEKRLEQYSKSYLIAVGQLKFNPALKEENLAGLRTILDQIHEEFQGRPYACCPCDLMSAVCFWCAPCNDPYRIQCAEFVAIILQRLGHLDGKVQCNLISPVNLYNVKSIRGPNKNLIKSPLIGELWYYNGVI